MTKITLTATAGEVTATADCELPVDVPAEQLQNVISAIAMGMGAGWKEMANAGILPGQGPAITTDEDPLLTKRRKSRWFLRDSQ